MRGSRNDCYYQARRESHEKSCYNPLLWTAGTIILVCILGLMTSYAIARMQWKLQKVTLIVFLASLMIPVQAVLLPLMIGFRKLHLINTYFALIIPYTAFSLPTAILIFVGFLLNEQSGPKKPHGRSN